MSVTPSMEAVNISVPILLVALPAAVELDTSWIETNSTALVMLSLVNDAIFCTIIVK